MSFVNSFAADSGDNYFLFLGRPSAWTSPYDDNNPPPTSDTLSSDLEAWRNMLALAKINKNNVIVGATRYDWEYNSVFDQFDDAIDLFEEGNERRRRNLRLGIKAHIVGGVKADVARLCVDGWGGGHHTAGCRAHIPARKQRRVPLRHLERGHTYFKMLNEVK